MGKGDQRTKKGKIIAKSFGKSRPHKERNKISTREAIGKVSKQEEEE